MPSPLVLDTGASSLKAGLAGTPSPQLLPCLVGRPKYQPVMQGAQQQLVCGKKLAHMQGILRLTSPIVNGEINNYDDMTRLWEELYFEMAVDHDHPVLLTKAPFCTQQQQVKVAEIFLEQFQVPAFQSASSGFLSLVGEGMTTGLVLTSGHGVSHAESFVEGSALNHAATQENLAGEHVSDQLHLLLSQRGHLFQSSAERQIVQKIKERCCAVLPQTGQTLLQSALASSKTDGSDQFVLPDGNTLTLEEEKFSAAEVLFQPSLVGKESLGLPDLLLSCLDNSEMDFRRTLVNNLVLAGGTTMLEGFPQRLVHELKNKVPQDNSIRMVASEGREQSAWRGGSVLATLDSFREHWVDQAMWAEHGDQALWRMALS